jgi:lysophospholipid acyltransferase
LYHSDFRRHVRPFFLTPDGTKPTAAKPYYDIASWLATQAVMSFTVAPFIILSFSDTLKAWSRVYFYGFVAVAFSMAVFSSPVKGYLTKTLKKRNRPPPMTRAVSADPPMLGLPGDPEKEVEGAVKEMMDEIEEMRKKGVSIPTGPELRALIEQNTGKKLV